MNPFIIKNGEVRIFQIPLKVPFITAAGRKDSTANVGVSIELADKTNGYGEASGSVVYAHLKPASLAAILRRELRRVLGGDVRRFSALAQGAWARCQDTSPAAAALECALLDALTRRLRIPMAEWFGGALHRLETDITLSAAGPPETRSAAMRATREGFNILKVKVGTGHARDLERVLSAWEPLKTKGRSAKMILDGNQGMTTASALRLAEECLRRKVPVALFEQPLPRGHLSASAALKRRSPIPLAADEDVRSPQEALQVLDMDAADVLNVKVAKTGLLASLEIMALTRAAGKRLMIGCMQESARGLSAGVHLAMGTGAFDFADLDSDHLLVPEQPAGNFKRNGPWLSL